jgi:hypothetical protein
MTGVHKQFDEALHAANDPRARKAFLERVLQEEFTAYENPNQYGIDIVIGSQPTRKYVELEVKKQWLYHDYPYPGNIHILARKERMAEDRWFCVMSDNLKRCAFIHSFALKYSKLAENPNSTVSEGEYAYFVPMEFVVFFDLKK